MNKSNHIHIIEDFINSEANPECDLRRISHLIISQGIREAEYHLYKNDGEKRESYRQTMLFLEEARDDIEMRFSCRDSFEWENYIILKEALEISHLLVGIKQNEERKYFDVLMGGLDSIRPKFLRSCTCAISQPHLVKGQRPAGRCA